MLPQPTRRYCALLLLLLVGTLLTTTVPIVDAAHLSHSNSSSSSSSLSLISKSNSTSPSSSETRSDTTTSSASVSRTTTHSISHSNTYSQSATNLTSLSLTQSRNSRTASRTAEGSSSPSKTFSNSLPLSVSRYSKSRRISLTASHSVSASCARNSSTPTRSVATDGQTASSSSSLTESFSSHDASETHSTTLSRTKPSGSITGSPTLLPTASHIKTSLSTTYSSALTRSLSTTTSKSVVASLTRSLSSTRTASQTGSSTESLTSTASLLDSPTPSQSAPTRSPTISTSPSRSRASPSRRSQSAEVTMSPLQTPSRRITPSHDVTVTWSAPTPSVSASKSLTSSVTRSASTTTSDTLSRGTATSSRSPSMSSSQTDSPTLSDSESLTGSNSISCSMPLLHTGSALITLSMTATRSSTVQTEGATLSNKTLTLSRSRLLDEVKPVRLWWVLRPTRYAAPGVAFPIQPVVRFDTWYNPHFAPRVCYLTSRTKGVVFLGNVFTRVIDNLCIFSQVGILAGPTSEPIELEVHLNTSGTRFPKLMLLRTNVTTVQLAVCPVTITTNFADPRRETQQIYAIENTRAKLLGNRSIIDTVVSGYYFPYEDRSHIVCSLNVSNGTAQFVLLQAYAQYLDMCHIRCVLSAESVIDQGAFLDIFQRGPFAAPLSVWVRGTRLISSCPGTATHLLLTGPHNYCDAAQQIANGNIDKCVISVFSEAVQRFLYDPPSKELAVDFVQQTNSFHVANVSVIFCDAANNTVTFASPTPSLGEVALFAIDNPRVTSSCQMLSSVVPLSRASLSSFAQLLGPSAAANVSWQLVNTVNSSGMSLTYGAICTNITSPMSNSINGTLACGNYEDFQAVDMTLTALASDTRPETVRRESYCVRNSRVNATFVTSLRIVNADAVLSTADDQATLPVPIAIEMLNWLGVVIVAAADNNRDSFPLNVDILQAVGGVVRTTTTIPINVSLQQSPIILDSIQLRVPGENFGIRVRAMADGMPSATLWGSDYPLSKNITVHSCGTFSSELQVVTSTNTVSNLTTCHIARNDSVDLSDRIWLRAASLGNTTVTVFGWKFEYSSSSKLRCHYSTLEDPFVGIQTVGVPATWISTCAVKCVIGPQQYPIRSASLDYFTAAGEVRSKASDSTLTKYLGTLRVKFGVVESWSNAIPLDVVGEAHTLAISPKTTTWSSLSFRKKDVTRLPTLTLDVVDRLGNSLLELDPEAIGRLVTFTVDPDVAPSLNNTATVNLTLGTCNPTPGVVIFDLILQSPQIMSYEFKFLSPNLSTLILPVSIVPLVNYTYFKLEAVTAPYNFVALTKENLLGILPKQPVVRAVVNGTNVTDTSISDISCLAVVSAKDGTLVTPNGCNSAFGNCAIFVNGIANFTSLQFTAVAGTVYTLTLKVVSTGESLNFTISVAECPNLPENLETTTALLSGPFNTSLLAPSLGFVIKGWRFNPSDGISCVFNGTVFPGVVYDYCTAACLAIPQQGVVNAQTFHAITTNVSLTGAAGVCSFSLSESRVKCRAATGGPIGVCPGACLLSPDGTNFTNVAWAVLSDQSRATIDFVGGANSVTSKANLDSNYTLTDGSVVVIAMTNIDTHSSSNASLNSSLWKLDALLVHLLDARGKFVDRVDVTSEGVVVTMEAGLLRVPSDIGLPTVRLPSSYNDDPESTCFPPLADLNVTAYDLTNDTTFENASLAFAKESTLQCRVQNGTCVFDNLFLRDPLVGQYIAKATAPSFVGDASFTIHVFPGQPNRLCIVTNMSGPNSYIPTTNNFYLPHPPLLYALDSGNNIFELASGNSLFLKLAPKKTFDTVVRVQGSAPAGYSVYVAILRKIDGIDGNYSLLPYQLQETATLANGYSAEFTAMSVNGTFGASFVLRFSVELTVPVTFAPNGDTLAPMSSPTSAPAAGNNTLSPTQLPSRPLLQQVLSPPLRLQQCSPNQYAYWGESNCVSCFTGAASCDGTSVDCFQCDGSTRMNVTTNFWRYSAHTYVAYQCPYGSCVGGTELGTCAEGYRDHSPLCGVCDRGYAPDFLGSCVKCSNVGGTAMLFAVACMAAVVAIAAIVFVTVTEQEDDDNSLVLLLKIVVNFVQTSGTIGQFAMNMPSTVKSFLGLQNSVSGGSGINIAPFNCLAPNADFMDKYKMQMLGPPIALLIVSVVVKAVSIRLRTDFRNLFSLVIMVFMFLIYQTLVAQSVAAMYCQPILGPNNQLALSVLKADARVNCLDSNYPRNFAIVLFSLAIYGLGIPSLALLLIMYTAQVSGWELAYVRFSFLISGYRLRYWYWEVLILARKIVLLLLVATTDNLTMQALLAIWLLTASLVMTIRCQPFVKSVLNRAESLALLVQLVTVNVGLFFRTVSSATSTCGPLCIFISAVLLIVNGGVFLYFGRHLLREGYFRVLSTFGLDVVHSDNQRYVSWRTMRKTILEQINHGDALATNFVNYRPGSTSKEVLVVENCKSDQQKVMFVDDDDGDEQLEILTLKPIRKAHAMSVMEPSSLRTFSN